MLGFHDHVIAPRSGKPEAPPSWPAGNITTWLTWTMSFIWLAGSVAVSRRWDDLTSSLQMGGAGLLFAITALLRRQALTRKKLALKRAQDAYLAMLDRPFL